ncbi:MAG TPA: hypothetical protein VD948_08300 [Rhodothermales bacterium]|nr:hypothetical protein [Rhodothermales bacterium]
MTLSPVQREVLLAVLVAALIPVLEQLVAFDPTAIANWRAWAVGLAAAMVRAAAAALLLRLGAARVLPPRG